MTLLIREADVERLVKMSDVIDAVERAERALGEGRAIHHARERVRLPTGMLHLMSGGLPDEGFVGYKAYTAFFAQPKEGGAPAGSAPRGQGIHPLVDVEPGRGAAGGAARPSLPSSVRFKVFLYSCQTGVLEAIVEGTRLGQMRTGAATAVAAKTMAQKDAGVVGLVGAGLQAAGQLEALACVRELREIRVYSRNPERLRAFCERFGARPAASARAAVEGADIVITATTSRDPVIEGAWLAPGAFVAAVGANLLVRREIDAQTLARAGRIVVDSVEQARRESGALRFAAEGGRLQWEQVHELREVVCGRFPGRARKDEITLFHSLGSSIWDLAAGALALARARAAGAGEVLPLD
jgi:ornithine cyclodeaminase/alanine dehydrogenase-like protein (mu-crystallin family)